MLNKLIVNVKKTMLVDEANIKSILFAVGFVLFYYQHILFSMLAQKPFVFFSDCLLIALNPAFSWTILIALMFFSLCSTCNNKIAKCLLQLIHLDFLITICLFSFGGHNSYWKHYSIIKTVFFERGHGPSERYAYYYEILESVFQHFPVNFFNLNEVTTGFMYFIITILGVVVISFYTYFLDKA